MNHTAPANPATQGAQDERLAARAFVYRALQAVTAGMPTKQNAEVVLSDVFAQAFEILQAPFDANEQHSLREAYEADQAGFLDQAGVNYTKLFYGPQKLVAPPWESSYVVTGRKIFQANTLDVRRAYRRQGLEPRALNKVPDDHISIELGFMAELADRMALGEAESSAQGAQTSEFMAAVSASASFLDSHLGKWAADYANDLSASGAGSFYPFVGSCIAALVEADRALFVATKTAQAASA